MKEAQLLDSVPVHVWDRIFSHIDDIRSRLRLELVSKQFSEYARRFCWNRDRILEVTPLVTHLLELRTVNVKVLADSQLIERKSNPALLSISCKVEDLPHVFECLISRTLDRIKDVRLWGSYNCILFPKKTWVDQCISTLSDRSLDYFPRISSLLMTSVFANSNSGADLVHLNARYLRTFHFLLAADHYDESRTAGALANICSAVSACTLLQDLVLELSDNQTISDEILVALLANKRDLRALRLRKIAGITGLGLYKALTTERLPYLQELEVAQCGDFHLGGFFSHESTLSDVFQCVKTFRYCPSEHDSSFGFALYRIPDTCPSIRYLDITDGSYSLHNPDNLAQLISQFLTSNQMSRKPKTLKVEAHCVLVLTLNQLKNSVLHHLTCDSVSQSFRQSESFSCSEYIINFTKGNAEVEFIFCVIK